MKSILKFRRSFFNPKLIALSVLFVGLILIATHAQAKDLLDGTTADVLDTMKGKGRNWAYIIDGAISLGAFAKTKNPFVFFSVLAVAVAMTVIVGMAGG